MKISSMVRASAMVGAAALLVAGSLQPANAAYGFEYDTATAKSWTTGTQFCKANGYEFNHSAVGCMAPNGDYIEPGDLKADHLRVGVEWWTSYGRHGLCANAAGKDAVFVPEHLRSPAEGKHLCNKDFREGATITYRAGTCNGSKVNCRVLSNWGNWSAKLHTKSNA